VSTLVCPPTEAFEAAYNLPESTNGLGMSSSLKAFDNNQLNAFSPNGKPTKNGLGALRGATTTKDLRSAENRNYYTGG